MAMKTRAYIVIAALLIIAPGFVMAQEVTVASQPETQTDMPEITGKISPDIEEKLANGQVSYTVYKVHNLKALIARRIVIDENVAEKDRALAHGKLLAFNPRILEQISGGELKGGEVSLAYYKKPVTLFVVLTQRFKKGELAAAPIKIEKQMRAVTVRWTGKVMEVEIEYFKGQTI